MKKEILQVPAGIRYITDWKEYSLDKYQFPHIINKQLTGCGFTEYCIKNEENVILCSPRKILLENKEKQHPNEVLYVRNNIMPELDFDKDFSRDEKEKETKAKTENEENGVSLVPESENSKKEDAVGLVDEIFKLRDQIKDHVYKCMNNQRPCKILVTYDSFRQVKETLTAMGIFDSFYVVVDEFQSLLVDSRFKSTTEVEFMSQLEGVQKLCYVSATPMMEKYLDMLDEFKDLPYYELDWKTLDQGRICRPRLIVKPVKSVVGEACRVINEYKSGKFKSFAYKNSDGKIIETTSKEAVIYMNSVTNICELIKRCNLTQENTNVLCAKTYKNEEKVRKAFGVKKKEFQGVGYVPTKGQPHKMFTLCTRTVYLGADFYSTCARSFVFSDANIKSLSVDITLDLPQILGRQRLDENPWKNSAELYFKSTGDLNKKTKKEFEEEIAEKMRNTEVIIQSFKSSPTAESKSVLADIYERDAKSTNYKHSYAAVNRHSGGNLEVVVNRLVLVAEMRSFEIQQVDYKDRFSVFSSITNEDIELADEEVANIEDSELNRVFKVFNELPGFPEKMEFLCTNKNKGVEYQPSIIKRLLEIIPEEYEKYYYVLGPRFILGYGCQRSRIEQEYLRRIQNQGLEGVVCSDLYNRFNVGDRYSCADAKKILGEVYSIHAYKRTPKATDINDFFETKFCSVDDPIVSGKRNRGFEIIKQKVRLE